MANSQTNQHVLVSYAAPSPILSSTKWTQVQAALASQFPLRNIHWKSPSRPSIRTIQELDVNLVPYDSFRDEHTQIPATLLEKPLLNLYFVVVQNTEIEGYRTLVKKQIKDWHSVVTGRKNQEWLIVHIIRPDTRTPSANFFQLKGSVFEKIRADFNTEKRERCIQVAWSPETDAPAVWAELINKIKDGILTAFDMAVAQKEDEVARSESQSQMPGWNFCTFFILKESLASSFEGVSLFEDAYAQYEELETIFYNVLKEKNLSWFGTLINPANGDDSAPLLSITRKPYRDLILANTISVFDFRIYLLSRQCELLARRHLINDISRKAAAFLGGFGRRLREVEATLPPFFIESWSYSSALSVVEYCDSCAAGIQLDGPNLKSFNAAKGELLELARTQLDVIGVIVKHLPPRPPFSSALTSSSPTVQNGKKYSNRISNLGLLEAMGNAEAFYNLYAEVTNRAIDMYAKAGRKKFALRLHGSIAALDLHRGQCDNAFVTYSSLPAHYAPQAWSSLESYMLSKALDTHTEFGKEKEKGTEWIHITLSFLKSYVENLGSESLIYDGDMNEYITRLVNDLVHASSKLEADLAHPNHTIVSLQVSSEVRIAGAQDGYFLDVTMNNYLPCTLQSDAINVILTGRDTEHCIFSTSAVTLPPGKIKVTLFCPAATAGIYILDSSELRIARLCLQSTHKKHPSRTMSTRKELPVLVRVPEDLLAFGVHISQPEEIGLGEPPLLLVSVSTGRNHILRTSLKLKCSGVSFKPSNAYFNQDKSRQPERSGDFIILSKLRKDSVVSFTIPHSDTSAFQAMKVTVEIEYTTASEPTLLRKLQMTKVVVTSLPFSINVEDFFRGARLLSKFTISATSHQHVRICSASLKPPEGGLEGVKITGTATKNRGVVTVTPVQPANFLFHIDSATGPVRESLTLLIRYRMLREEVEEIVEESVKKVLANPSDHNSRVTVVTKLIEALEGDAGWVDLYGITGELKIPDTSRKAENEETQQLLVKAKEVLQEHRHPYPPQGKWREIKIPVDIPFMNIIAAACIRILSNHSSDIVTSQDTTYSLYAGQPISARITIDASFHWGSGTGDKERQYMLRYDVEEMVRDWLINGAKRCDFVAKDGETFTMPITLIALHHGELSLPKVSVTALPMAGELTMGSMAIPNIETYQIHGAEKVLVLPRGGRSTFVVGMGSNSS